MKQPSDLFQLIKSLTKSEKRYFRLWSSLQEGEKKYLLLFDAIDEQEEDNHDALLEQFKKERFSKQLHVAKNYLHKLLLKSLNAFYAESSADFILKALIQHVDILYQKSFYKQAVSFLKKAKQMAYQYENYIALLEILKWEKIFINFSQKQEAHLLHAEEKIIINHINEVNNSWGLYMKIHFISVSKGIARSTGELKECRKYIENLSEKKFHSCMANLYKYAAYAEYYETIGNFKKNYLYRKKVVELMEANPGITEERSKTYLAALSNFLVSQAKLSKLNDFLLTVGKIKKLPETNKRFNRKDMKVMVFTSSVLHELSTYVYLRHYDKALAITSEVEKGLEEFDDALRILVKVSAWFNLSYTYFATEQYNKALLWINKIIQLPKFDKREDIQCFAKILNLMIHSELRNNDAMEYIVKSTYNFLLKRKRLYKFETILLKFLKKSSGLINDKESMKEAYIKLKTELLPLLKEEFEKIPFEYFDFLSWIESKIEKRPFAEIVKEKATALRVMGKAIAIK